METARFLMSVAPTFPPPGTGRAGGTPAAIEVVVWYHALIAVKIYRALASAAMSQQGKPGLADDAQGSAKVALIGMDRSRKALRQLQAKLHDSRIERLCTGSSVSGPKWSGGSRTRARSSGRDWMRGRCEPEAASCEHLNASFSLAPIQGTRRMAACS